MGILTEYFAATPERARAAAETGPSDELEPLRCKFVDPAVLGGALWEVVRHGRLGSPRNALYASAERVDTNDEFGPYLVRLKPDFVRELAALPDERLLPVATEWRTAEEWMGEPEVELIAELVVELRRVARAASGDGLDAYCWMCL
ncbi:hypothetical protein ABZV78_10645 [Micromonospora sp. NPDC004540]|uniref:hypothetical protein n=1 Tax=Micromonospora sp. NPDC004540 TaxID=3154457 RepID=UPI0033B78A7D